MQNILVIGGTRFFGKNLVQLLIKNGHNVTILTRGNTKNAFGEDVRYLTADRQNEIALETVLKDKNFDIVYDNICYSFEDAVVLCRLLKGKTKKLIFTSTMSVYEIDGLEKKEEDFDPYTYQYLLDRDLQFDYGERKRMAEAAFFKYADFPVTAVRFPIVMGEEDYTKRLYFYIEKIASDESFEMQNLDAKTVFINANEAASFLEWIGQQSFEGPINASADGAIKLETFIHLIEAKVSKNAKVILSEVVNNQSPYSLEDSWYMTNTKAKILGYRFSKLESWLPLLIENILKGIRMK